MCLTLLNIFIHQFSLLTQVFGQLACISINFINPKINNYINLVTLKFTKLEPVTSVHLLFLFLLICGLDQVIFVLYEITPYVYKNTLTGTLLTPTAKCLEIVYITIIEHLMFILFLHSRFAFNQDNRSLASTFSHHTL